MVVLDILRWVAVADVLQVLVRFDELRQRRVDDALNPEK